MESKVILFITTSLDGMIAGPNHELDWLLHDQDYGYTAFYDDLSAVVMGRKTYDVTMGFGEYPYPNTEGYVLSHSRTGSDDHVTFVNKDLPTFFDQLKLTTHKNIWLIGGAQLAQDCAKLGLIDEYYLYIHPLILGEGIPLWGKLPRIDLELVRQEAYSSGMVLMVYKKKG